MIHLKGKYCKDCIVFTDNVEQEALSIIYHFLDNPMFDGAKIRIMPDVHAGKDIVVGFTVPFTNHVNPDHVGGDIGCSVSTVITEIPVCPANYPQIEKTIRENVKFGMTIHSHSVYQQAELYRHLQTRLQEYSYFNSDILTKQAKKSACQFLDVNQQSNAKKNDR